MGDEPGQQEPSRLPTKGGTNAAIFGGLFIGVQDAIYLFALSPFRFCGSYAWSVLRSPRS